MRAVSTLALACALALAASIAGAQPSTAQSGAVVARYDASRDAAADIERGRAAAAAQRKQVLLVVGGDWCKDCRELDKVFAQNADLAALRDRRFVLVKVFIGTENRNEAVLARYPKIDWVPTLIELDDAGKVVKLTPSTEFHTEDKLDAAKIRRYLESG